MTRAADGRSVIIDEDSSSQIMDDNDYTDSIHDTIITACDYDNGNYDDTDDLDDLDIFMRNNSVRENGNKFH